MKIVYTMEEAPESYSKSIFLAGPTPRNKSIPSWRPQALELLRTAGYDGVVYVPEERPGTEFKYVYPFVPQWENKMLNRADVILFWIPRDLTVVLDEGGKPKFDKNGVPELKMPAFTTNVEFGYWIRLGKVVLGAPPRANHLAYLRFMMDKHHTPYFFKLEDTVNKTLELIGSGVLRHGGERDIPLCIWNLRAFQRWHQAQTGAGNRLDGATVEWISRVRNKPEAIFAFAIKPNVFIASENRNKVNDPVIFRLDISNVLLFKREANLMESKIVLIKEFRTAASTKDGFIWELPGGSSPFITDPLEVASEEVHEEVGLVIDKNRLNYGGSRQLAGTLSAHQAHFYHTELTNSELDWLYKQKGIPHGADLDNPTGERAYTEVRTLKEIEDEGLLDWSNLGMIYAALMKSPEPL